MHYVRPLLLICLFASGPGALSQDYPQAELYGGYSFLNIDTNGATSRQNTNGWEASYSGSFNRWWAAEVDVSGYYKTYLGELTSLGQGAVTVKALMREYLWAVFPCPPGPLAADMGALTAGACRLRTSTDRAILGLFGGSLLELSQRLFRMDRFMEMLAGEPLRVHAFLDRLLEAHLAALDRFVKAVGGYIDVVCFSDDLGAQNGPLLSPKMYREFFKPRHSHLWRRAKELADVKVMLHCCGAVRSLLPDLIEAGIDAINPVQISCRGMDAGELKREFGKDLTFWGGGCDTQFVLPSASPEEVRTHVLRQIATFSPGGGFVFQQVHNIQTDVPAENIVAMFRAVNPSLGIKQLT